MVRFDADRSRTLDELDAEFVHVLKNEPKPRSAGCIG